jgi:hypothetical protein
MELQKHHLCKTNFPSEAIDNIMETERKDKMDKVR